MAYYHRSVFQVVITEETVASGIGDVLEHREGLSDLQKTSRSGYIVQIPGAGL